MSTFIADLSDTPSYPLDFLRFTPEDLAFINLLDFLLEIELTDTGG